MSIFKKKKKFQKSYVIKNAKADFGLDQDHDFAFWADPSKEVLFGLLSVMATDKEELDKMSDEKLLEINDRFYHNLSELILECDIEGTDFSSADKARDSLELPHIDWRFMYKVVGLYLAHLIEKHDLLKKTLETLEKEQSFGEENSSKA